MERLPQGIYTAEFRVKAVKRVLEQKMSVDGAAKRLSLSKSSLNNWVVAAKAGQLATVGKDRRQPSEMELELARLRKELAETIVFGSCGINNMCRSYEFRAGSCQRRR